MSRGLEILNTHLPTVAIVGRPNVGKSTLFNRIVGRRKAVVLDKPGMTRDRNFETAEWCGRLFTLIDTGGYESSPRDTIYEQMREQSQAAIQEADVVVFITDVKEEGNPVDQDVATFLRRSHKPILVVVNKCDNTRRYQESFAFFALGFDEVFPISALNGGGMGDMLDRLMELLPPNAPEDAAADSGIRVAVIGRPNVGKSSLVNALLGRRRVITSDIPGTTRDTIDTTFRLRPDPSDAPPAPEDPSESELFEAVIEDEEYDFETAEAPPRRGKARFQAEAEESGEDEEFDDDEVDFEDEEGIQDDEEDEIEEEEDEADEEEDDDGDGGDEVEYLDEAGSGEPEEEEAGAPDQPKPPKARPERVYTLIDTAGLRRPGKIERGEERLSSFSAQASLRRCDVALILIDAQQGLTEQDKHVAGYAHEAHRACILLVNKWDLLQKDNSTSGAFARQIRDEMGFLHYAPILMISAKTGQRVHRILDLVDTVYREYARKIDTPRLNRWLKGAVLRLSPPWHKGRQLHIKYVAQVGLRPPTFAFFVNHPQYLHFSYRRYLANRLREAFGFQGSPIRLLFRKKTRKDVLEERG